MLYKYTIKFQLHSSAKRKKILFRKLGTFCMFQGENHSNAFTILHLPVKQGVLNVHGAKNSADFRVCCRSKRQYCKPVIFSFTFYFGCCYCPFWVSSRNARYEMYFCWRFEDQNDTRYWKKQQKKYDSRDLENKIIGLAKEKSYKEN